MPDQLQTIRDYSEALDRVNARIENRAIIEQWVGAFAMHELHCHTQRRIAQTGRRAIERIRRLVRIGDAS